jgi:cell division GTPase FtsZ
MEAGDYISSKVDADAEFIMGAVHDEALGDEVCVTIVATGVSPRSDVPAAARAARQQQVAAASIGNGSSRSSSPNPFQVPAAAAPAAAAAPKAEPVVEKSAAAPAGNKGGVQVPAFLRNMHRKK